MSASDDIEYTSLALNISIVFQFSHIVIEMIQLFLFSYNGSGIGILTFLSNLTEVMSQLVIIILLILMSTGWGVRNKEAPALDVLVPIILLVVIV